MKKLILSGFIAAGSIIALAMPPKIHESGQPGVSRTPIIAGETVAPGTPTMQIPSYLNGVLEHLRAEAKSQRVPGKSLAAMNPDALDMYGYLWWSNNVANLPGLYLVEEDMGNRLAPDYGYDLYNYKKLNGWYLEDQDKYAGVNINMDIEAGFISGYCYYTVDIQTGNTSSVDYGLSSFMFQKCAYQPELQRVYGYLGNLSSSQEEYFWAYAPVDNIANVTYITDPEKPLTFDSYCYALCYSPADSKFYGVNGKNQFVRIDRETGEQTLLLDLTTVIGSGLKFDVGDNGTYWAGLTWNEGDNRFYFNAPYRNTSSNIPSSTIMAIIPGADGKYTAQEIFTLPDAMNFSFLFTKVDGPTGNQPIAPIPGKVSFEGASLTGTVAFYLPDSTGDGDVYPAGTTVTWTATLDGDIYEVDGKAVTGTDEAGAEVTVTYTVAEPGMHVFGMYATVNGINSPRGYRVRYVGNDTPSAPANVSLNSKELTWSPVTTGVNGGYVNTADMTYEVTLNGKVLGTTKDTAYDMTSLIPATGELTGYDATVTAICNGLKSAASESNHFVWGEPYYITEELPYYIQPTKEQWEQMTAIDANGDKRVVEHLNNWTLGAWKFNPEGGYDGGVTTDISIQSSGGNDDYLFLPPVQLEETENYYKMSFYCAGEGGDAFDLFYTTTPDLNGEQHVFLSNFEPRVQQAPGAGKTWDYVETYFQIPTPDVYYICVHAKSTSSYHMHMNRITVELSDVNGNSPQELSYLVLSPAANGVNRCAVTMLPSEFRMDGTRFPEGEMIWGVITVNGEPAMSDGKEIGPVELDPNIKSGTIPVSVWVDTQQSGNHGDPFDEHLNKVNVQVYSKTGDNINWGPISRGEVYTGLDYPATPKNVRGEVLANYGSALITWDPVTAAATGGTIDPEGVWYQTVLYQEPNEYTRYWLNLQQDKEPIYDTEYTFNLLETYNWMDHFSFEDAPQGWYSVGVVSYNAAGSNKRVGYVDLLMGKPFDLPYEDNFMNPESVYGNDTEMWVPISELDGVTRIGTWARGTLTEGFALLGRCNTAGSGAILIPPFSTKGQESAILSMSVRTGSNAPSFKLLYEEPITYVYTEIGSYEAKEGPAEFETLDFAIPANLLDKDALKIYIVPTYASSSEQFWMNRIGVTGNAGVGMTTADSAAIYGTNGGIVVKGAAGEEISVWGIDGSLVKKAKAGEGRSFIHVTPGVYVVKAGTRTAKVIVK